jgi:cytochrome c-type biogenesis protein CcmH
VTARRGVGTSVLIVLLLAGALALVTAGGHGSRSPQARARAVEAQLRCPVCAGQSVAESRTETAAAMRAQVQALVGENHTDGQIRDWFSARYGRSILLRPATRGSEAMLWMAPFIPAAVGGWILLRRRRGAAARTAADAPVFDGGQ